MGRTKGPRGGDELVGLGDELPPAVSVFFLDRRNMTAKKCPGVRRASIGGGTARARLGPYEWGLFFYKDLDSEHPRFSRSTRASSRFSPSPLRMKRTTRRAVLARPRACGRGHDARAYSRLPGPQRVRPRTASRNIEEVTKWCGGEHRIGFLEAVLEFTSASCFFLQLDTSVVSTRRG